MSAPTDEERAQLECIVFLPVEGKWCGTRFVGDDLDLFTVSGPEDSVDAKLTWDGMVHSKNMESSITLESWQAELRAKAERREARSNAQDDERLRQIAKQMEKEREAVRKDAEKRAGLRRLVSVPTEGKLLVSTFTCASPNLTLELAGGIGIRSAVAELATLYPDGTLLLDNQKLQISTKSWEAELAKQGREAVEDHSHVHFIELPSEDLF